MEVRISGHGRIKMNSDSGKPLEDGFVENELIPALEDDGIEVEIVGSFNNEDLAEDEALMEEESK